MALISAGYEVHNPWGQAACRGCAAGLNRFAMVNDKDSAPPITAGDITGALLAGGRSVRMGRDKGLVELAGRPLMQHVIARLRPQVHRIMISANGDPERFAGTCLPVVADTVGDHAGPLAGLHTAFEWSLCETPDARFVATIPVDTPFFPADLVQRLADAVRVGGAPCAIAASAGHQHPVIGLWEVALIEEVADALQDGVRAVHRFAEMEKCAVVEFPLVKAGDMEFDPFFNINTPEDVETAEAIMAALAATEPERG